MVRVCVIKGCKSKANDTNVSLFKLPHSNIILMHQWIQQMKNPNSDDADDVSYTQSDRICSLHFDEANIRRTQYGVGLLVKDAVPMYFPWSERDKIAVGDVPNKPESSPKNVSTPRTLKRQFFSSFSIKRFKDKPEVIKRYTGFCSIEVFEQLFNFFSEPMKKLSKVGSQTESKSNPNPGTPSTKLGRKRVLEMEKEFFMTLIRLRRCVPVDILGDMFGVAASTASRTINTWLIVMSKMLRLTPIWRTRQDIQKNLPDNFATCRSVRAILDCTEIEIERPSDTNIQKESFSNYKQRNTVKGLIAVSPDYQITFVSQLYHGSTSDKKIVRHCGILDKFEMGDAIMADRGFDNEEDCKEKGLQLIIPDFLRQATQLTPLEVERTREIAKLRIKVENKIGAVKFFRILHQKLPLSLHPLMDQIWTTCNYLVNFMEPLKTDEEYDIPSPAYFVEVETTDAVAENREMPHCSRVLFPQQVLRNVHYPMNVIDDFLLLAKDNSDHNIETGAFLAGVLKDDRFLVTHMIIPKQTGGADYFVCEDDKEIHSAFSQHSVIGLGWIHTHPSHATFMSSVDLHTQYPFQCLLPEFFAIVCSIINNETKIFTIESKVGMEIIKNCKNPDRFHEHPTATAPVFHECNHLVPDAAFDVVKVDLR